MKLVTDLFTLDAAWVTATLVAAEGLDRRAAVELSSALTDEVMALVWLGKALLVELTNAVAAV